MSQPTSIPALSESIQGAHRYTTHLESVLHNVLYALGPSTAGNSSGSAEPSSGLQSEANGLCYRLNNLIAVAEMIQGRVAPEMTVKADYDAPTTNKAMWRD